MGVAGFQKMVEGLAGDGIAEYLEGKGIRADTSDLNWRTSKLAYLTQMPARAGLSRPITACPTSIAPGLFTMAQGASQWRSLGSG